jgi:nucleotide-binding universal stress UspA family protein
MRRILVGVDGSKESRDAAFYAAELARATGAKLTLACAVFAHDLLTDPEFVARTAHWEQEDRERGDAVVKEMAAAVARPGVNVETLVAGGPAAATLAWVAKGRDVDLVVVGHRGRSALARLLLGSVADRLVQICPKPVLVVH